MANEYLYKSPELLDRIIGNMQKGLSDNIGWLDNAFGRAERTVKYNDNGKRIYIPTVYIGENDYREVSPDSQLGN